MRTVKAGCSCVRTSPALCKRDDSKVVVGGHWLLSTF
jgi:hypothetical protein